MFEREGGRKRSDKDIPLRGWRDSAPAKKNYWISWSLFNFIDLMGVSFFDHFSFTNLCHHCVKCHLVFFFVSAIVTDFCNY